MAACDAVKSAAAEAHHPFGAGAHIASAPGMSNDKPHRLVQPRQHGGKHDPRMAASSKATAIPAKPAPAVRSAVSRCCANSSLTAINPAKAPPPPRARTTFPPPGCRGRAPPTD
jgi:hypothetical protein